MIVVETPLRRLAEGRLFATVEYMGGVPRTLTIGTESICYLSRVHKRARHIRISFYYDGRIAVTRPPGVSITRAEHFLRDNYDLMRGKMNTRVRAGTTILPQVRLKEYPHIKQQACSLVQVRLRHFNQIYGFVYNRVVIKKHKTLWGSCSVKRNLNFNYNIIFLPQELADYIIVHELCHLKEHNHSSRFWALVAHTIPNWQERRKQLRLYRHKKIG
ncbi:MAG: hypothetical protein UV70_C0006G0004 [Parcubacteria group bacterium GW2011_GWA2_43_13]|nr:MAG: hypothetical protein UV70_C0006G0004 [Parcubacteria group bacterium GW2011_GWA2_43_13]OGY70270.1 MAG: hypothetical protein A2986_04370 [Candidatus Jacksonbacteria bacterium RIFCSPLOWO2_01_FULL_44_13]HAZ16962.1 hypothetical protein [Candidatus Jacksonbacteria bacterium]